MKYTLKIEADSKDEILQVIKNIEEDQLEKSSVTGATGKITPGGYTMSTLAEENKNKAVAAMLNAVVTESKQGQTPEQSTQIEELAKKRVKGLANFIKGGLKNFNVNDIHALDAEQSAVFIEKVTEFIEKAKNPPAPPALQAVSPTEENSTGLRSAAAVVDPGAQIAAAILPDKELHAKRAELIRQLEPRLAEEPELFTKLSALTKAAGASNSAELTGQKLADFVQALVVEVHTGAPAKNVL